jgi:hypothetical protein
MAYINQPIDLRLAFDAIKDRLRKLETAVRFTAPDVSTEPTYPRVGDIIYDNSTDQMKYWNGIIWVVFGDNNLGVPVISYNSIWSGTGLTYTGTPTTAQYSRVGKMITFNIKVNCTTVTNFGTGQYHLTLPFTPYSNFVFRNAGLHDTSANNHYSILGDSNSGSTDIELLYSKSQGSHVEDSPFNHNSPVTLATGDFFYISGTYFIA